MSYDVSKLRHQLTVVSHCFHDSDRSVAHEPQHDHESSRYVT